MLQGERNLPEQEQLTAVNRFFNQQLDFQDDARIWRQSDYWATPVEALIKAAGDCEDYALAKYFSLRQLGIPSDKLRITYVKALKQNQAHMVLTYYSSPGAEPLVLDNLIGDIRPASQRKDLLPVYAFNADGLYLPGKPGTLRSGDRVLSSGDGGGIRRRGLDTHPGWTLSLTDAALPVGGDEGCVGAIP